MPGTAGWSWCRARERRRRSAAMAMASRSPRRARRRSRNRSGWRSSRSCTTRRRAPCSTAPRIIRCSSASIATTSASCCAVRGRRRYVAKGNYNVTRIGYLAKLFPDARFVIPVRDPVWHIASLMKQHRLFLDGQRDNPAARRHLRRVGHFEFGEDRRPIRIGDGATTAEIVALWQAGEEVRGWARYWAQIHHHIADLMERRRDLRPAIRIVRYEDLCASPQATLRAVLDHCALPARESVPVRRSRTAAPADLLPAALQRRGPRHHRRGNGRGGGPLRLPRRPRAGAEAERRVVSAPVGPRESKPILKRLPEKEQLPCRCTARSP